MPTQKNEGPRCSFCNKPQADVLRLVFGPDVSICNECVEICNDVLSEDKAPPAHQEEPALQVFASPHFGPLVRCRLCRVLYAKEQCAAIQDRGWLCEGC